jgi:hypothetical protein
MYSSLLRQSKARQEAEEQNAMTTSILKENKDNVRRLVLMLAGKSLNSMLEVSHSPIRTLAC